MKLLFPLLFVSLFFATYRSAGQSFEVPKNFDPKNTASYSKYNKDVVNCINWLENTPVDKDTAQRKEAGSFLVMWISGSPDVSISINSNLIELAQSSSALLLAYMGGWTKYAIESGKYTDSVKGNLAGIRSVIKVYKANSSIKRDKEIDHLAALDKKGELEKWEEEHNK